MILQARHWQAPALGNDHLLNIVKVIVITDALLMRDGLVHALGRQASMRVMDAAATPDEALGAIAKRLPAVALLDLSMAGWLDILLAVRRAAPHLHVVAFSVGDNDDDLLTCIKLGVVGFVPKHGTITHLVAACEGALREEAHCCPRIAARLFHRLAALAPAAVSDATPAAAPLLSPRELEIAELIDSGLPNKAIAQRLSIGLATVKNHVHNILQKLHVTTRGEAVALLRHPPAPASAGQRAAAEPKLPVPNPERALPPAIIRWPERDA
ncbi:MAG: response regulator transcription factor [Pseudomonadales bacterium]|jgi:DNA-binding NarL/FixJ family response regulator|nr:response regulator transcription factor [Pseudomonadales bacterium]